MVNLPDYNDFLNVIETHLQKKLETIEFTATYDNAVDEILNIIKNNF